ncbi:hypothetical protein EAG_05913 [Camponotus floridanus]|uniref:Uncharacterized protein n=1 Tax=Camponotus floridanus TaxID=104421 RepID=E2AY74_CAMFO|nr:hypothetical protein EAG_05913 [Camponotus floridanus]
MAKPERLRFTILEDLILLREVLRQNPYEESDRWKAVAEYVVNATQKNFSLRCIKEHVDHLLKIWAREGHAHLRKSGTEEQYNEKERLLQQVQDLQREFRCSNKSTNAQKSRMQTREIIENISDTLEKSTLQFLQERHKKEVEFQEKQFRLEERRIQLEEEKFRMEKKEREARLELEIEERRQRISVSKQKQEILEILLQLIHKP